jgi:SAM-dependent methyltransferase
MAAGMNASGFIHRELDPGVNYSFFDYSPFVVSYLRTAAELTGSRNVSVVEADLNRLTRPVKPLAVLRTKNAVHYVPGFDKKLEEMADWIAPGGQLVIQNDPNPAQRSMIVEKHGPLIRRLISEGWTLDFGFAGKAGKWGGYALDTLTLTRPALAAKKSPQETARQWASYEDAVKYLQARFNPLDFLFR